MNKWNTFILVARCSNPNTIFIDRDQSVFVKFFLVFFQNLYAKGTLFCSTMVNNYRDIGKSIRSCATILWAYTKQACMSSGSIQSYPLRIISAVSPAASIPNTCSTANRLPRIIGFPPKISGLKVIRSSSFFSSMKIKIMIKTLNSLSK